MGQPFSFSSIEMISGTTLSDNKFLDARQRVGVMYLVAAINRIAMLSNEQIRILAAELNAFDTRGIDISKPDASMYHLRFYPNEVFSVRKLVALKYAVSKITGAAIGVECGFFRKVILQFFSPEK